MSIELTFAEITLLQKFYELDGNTTSEQLGGLLNRSRKTIDFHWGNIYQKLGVTNRCAAIIKALKLNLV